MAGIKLLTLETTVEMFYMYNTLTIWLCFQLKTPNPAESIKYVFQYDLNGVSV